MPYATHPKRGFTIVELITIIAVIGILAAIGIVSYMQVQRQSRDGQRQGDITILQNELERFYDNNGTYPPGCPAVSCNDQVFLNNTSASAFTALSTIATVQAALPKIPSTFHDPNYQNNTHVFIGNGDQVGQYYYFGGAVNNGAATSTTYAASGVPCTFRADLTGTDASSYVIGYRSEASGSWIFIGGKHGVPLTVTAGGCIINT